MKVDPINTALTIDNLEVGMWVTGLTPQGPVEILQISRASINARSVVFRDANDSISEVLILRGQDSKLSRYEARVERPFDASPSEWKLGAEAVRIQNASSYDPMVALTSSDLDPLPHQLRAVYEDLLPRTPLRFLLADDPGAGKTVMAGLYVKELMLRSDADRVLIVVPGGLVDQWQDELAEKFGLNFEILTREAITGSYSGNVFKEKRLVLAKMDMLARDSDLLDLLKQSYWDVVIVDEAHRMSAHYYGDEVTRTKRFDLGVVLGQVARHLLLMTATPHNGNNDDFQLFLSLLDPDRFAGRIRSQNQDVPLKDVMRRMVKEDLRTMDGKALFPERKAYTLEYQLSDAEQELYDVVTAYVRDQLIMLQQLESEVDEKRKNNIGFALTVLQRRLASSPEAILRSLERRQAKLFRAVAELNSNVRDKGALDKETREILGHSDIPNYSDLDDEDYLELSSLELEEAEESAVVATSIARSERELNLEIAALADLINVAKKVHDSGTDKKWQELKKLLTGDKLVRAEDGSIRKIIIFTEHRDTLNYLQAKISGVVDDTSQIERIDGGTPRSERKKIQERFMNDPNSRILIATDAAGEGLNLQRAHLMVNYDLPWNPNRIEQRFGRIHRIGQSEVCHLWNLVAVSTREGQVFQRLLHKLEEMRQAYQGKVFDVLGEALGEVSLREMLIEAIQYGDDPARKQERDMVIDAAIGEGIRELLEERALHADTFDLASVEKLKRAFEEAQARKLQPHYIKAFFLETFVQLGGLIEEREPGRYEIMRVPAAVIARGEKLSSGIPIIDRYERVTFETEGIHHQSGLRAQLIAPGHPLMNAVTDLIVEAAAPLLKSGAVFIDESDMSSEPRLLVGLKTEISNGVLLPNGKYQTVDKNFEFVEIAESGAVHFAGPAPYLDYSTEFTWTEPMNEVIHAAWLSNGAENVAREWAVEERIPERVRVVGDKIQIEVSRIRAIVKERLSKEIQHWDELHDHLIEQAGPGRGRISPENAFNRARMFEKRLSDRLELLSREEHLVAIPPQVSSCALVIPKGLLDLLGGISEQSVSSYAKDTKEVERRAVTKTLAAEHSLGRTPEEMPHNNPGWDIRSECKGEPTIFIEVKGRIEGADTFSITRNEVLTAKNIGLNYRLSLVRVSMNGSENDEVRYVPNPFMDYDPESFLVCSYTLNWEAMWLRGLEPH